MKKILKMTAILLILAGCFYSCAMDNNENNENNAPVSLESLEGTKWKLKGIVDVRTGILKEIVPRGGSFDPETRILTDGDPIDCEECYALFFTSDTIAHGRSIHNEVWLHIFDPIQISSTNIPFSKKPEFGGTKIGESPEPTLYMEALWDLTSYIYYNNELKLFYNENKNYLLFKLVAS